MNTQIDELNGKDSNPQLGAERVHLPTHWCLEPLGTYSLKSTLIWLEWSEKMVTKESARSTFPFVSSIISSLGLSLVPKLFEKACTGEGGEEGKPGVCMFHVIWN